MICLIIEFTFFSKFLNKKNKFLRFIGGSDAFWMRKSGFGFEVKQKEFELVRHKYFFKGFWPRGRLGRSGRNFADLEEVYGREV